ncbi:site-specific integrase [Bradyrhizobium barranii subsp. apii]|uniref:Site-specific integrase n=1 Tax=Bradyrhizobium barranii subsp. apii TaxID=2819348 RepID=A0A8T5V3J0_9BRAD|nr:site-specific integrase [Bradyrhizobium barranii]UPT87963.1 site-specific integrase [Bradyrhizobium barranii subsp. apii]
MARSVYSDKLKNRTNRLKLAIRKKPYKAQVAPGIFLAYRRNEGPGTWSVQAGWLKRFAIADDFENANNKSVMTFYQAQAHALKMARGSEGDSDKPVTVAEAIDAYETDLAARGGIKYNATSLRGHLSPAMLSKVVMLLTETELSDWRNGLVAKGLKLSSANRIGKSFKAALALAAKRDKKRITNSAAWKEGLKPQKAKGSNAPPRDNYYLPDGTILAIVRECYVEDADFGALIDTLAGTGVRESQALKLWPDDLQDDDAEAPRLMMHCSAKGRDRDPEQRALPITPKLAEMLRARAIARGANRLLFDRIWNLSARFRAVLERLDLDLDLSLTPYTLRHSSIIRQIRSNTPLRLIAFTHDTSVVEIERTYARYLNHASDDARKGLLADAMPPADNVVRLARG